MKEGLRIEEIYSELIWVRWCPLLFSSTTQSDKHGEDMSPKHELENRGIFPKIFGKFKNQTKTVREIQSKYFQWFLKLW